MLSGVHLLAVEIIKIYDDKGHTVLKKRILEHLNVGKGDLLVAELREDNTVVLKALRKEMLLTKLKHPEKEDEVLKEKTVLRFEMV